jgi:acyl-CoA thioesterase-1
LAIHSHSAFVVTTLTSPTLRQHDAPRRAARRLRLLAGAGLALVATAFARADSSAPPVGTLAAPGRIVFLGDSLTAGFGLDSGEDYPALIEQKIADAGLAARWTVVNAGVSGDTSADGLRRLNWLLREPVGILVLELGGNDGLRGQNLASTEANLQAILDQVRAKDPGARFVIAGMLMPGSLGPDYTTQFAALFPRLAQRNHAVLIPFLLDGVALKPDLMQPDSIHPNAAGAQIVAATVWKYLAPMVQDQAPAAAPANAPAKN